MHFNSPRAGRIMREFQMGNVLTPSAMLSRCPCPAPPSPRRRTREQPRAAGRRGWRMQGLMVAGWAALLGLLPAQDSADPLWARAVADMVRSPHYRADTVASVMTVYDGSEKKLGSVETRNQLEFEAGKPVWKEKHRKKTGDPGMIITMDMGLQNDPREVLTGYEGWTLVGKETLDGAAVEVWLGKLPASPDNLAVAYLDSATARPRRLKFTQPYKTIIGTIQLTVEVDYAAGPEGTWLPSRTVVDQAGRIFFKKRRIHIENDYRDWKPIRPVDAPAKEAVASAPP